MIKIFFFQILIFYPIFFFLFKNNYLTDKFVDQEFGKIQSFHKKPTPRFGGIIILITILISYFFFIEHKQDYKFIIYSIILNTLVGTFDDLKIVRDPLKRFFILFFPNIFLIIFFEIRINNYDFPILDYLNNFKYLSILLTYFCIFFLINGSNLIDGFNGLLSLHSIIIIGLIYFILNQNNIEDYNTFIYIIFFSIIFFFTINFPRAYSFLGDGGAYLIGSLIASLIIILSNKITILSPFFFAILIHYLFFEILFSVFRKLILKKNPFYPDGEHLHMLVYSFLNKKFKNANYLTSLVINFYYIIFMIPAYFFYNNILFCKLYFLILIFNYILIYFFLKKLEND